MSSPAQAAQPIAVPVVDDQSKEQVGRRLYISPSSLCTPPQRVRAKYAAVGRPAPTKAALVARAVQDGDISVGEL
jgi:hypothetical protein